MDIRQKRNDGEHLSIDIFEFQNGFQNLDHSWHILNTSSGMVRSAAKRPLPDTAHLRAVAGGTSDRAHEAHDTRSSSWDEPREPLIVFGAPPRALPKVSASLRKLAAAPRENLVLHCTNAISKKLVNVPFFGHSDAFCELF